MRIPRGILIRLAGHQGYMVLPAPAPAQSDLQYRFYGPHAGSQGIGTPLARFIGDVRGSHSPGPHPISFAPLLQLHLLQATTPLVESFRFAERALPVRKSSSPTL